MQLDLANLEDLKAIGSIEALNQYLQKYIYIYHRIYRFWSSDWTDNKQITRKKIMLERILFFILVKFFTV